MYLMSAPADIVCMSLGLSEACVLTRNLTNSTVDQTLPTTEHKQYKIMYIWTEVHNISMLVYRMIQHQCVQSALTCVYIQNTLHTCTYRVPKPAHCIKCPSMHIHVHAECSTCMYMQNVLQNTLTLTSCPKYLQQFKVILTYFFFAIHNICCQDKIKALKAHKTTTTTTTITTTTIDRLPQTRQKIHLSAMMN